MKSKWFELEQLLEQKVAKKLPFTVNNVEFLFDPDTSSNRDENSSVAPQTVFTEAPVCINFNLDAEQGQWLFAGKSNNDQPLDTQKLLDDIAKCLLLSGIEFSDPIETLTFTTMDNDSATLDSIEALSQPVDHNSIHVSLRIRVNQSSNQDSNLQTAETQATCPLEQPSISTEPAPAEPAPVEPVPVEPAQQTHGKIVHAGNNKLNLVQAVRKFYSE